MKSNYAKAFRIIRAAFGLTQSELAARMGMNASHLSLIESGKRHPSLRALEEFARAVGVPAALISVLASTERDIEFKDDKDISDLARALLRLLITAKEEPQRSLGFEGGK
jgi:transcriptional regulator with XRE-family HTH domain